MRNSFLFILLVLFSSAAFSWEGKEYYKFIYPENWWVDMPAACQARAAALSSEMDTSEVPHKSIYNVSCSTGSSQGTITGYRSGGIYTTFAVYSKDLNDCAGYTYTYPNGQCSNNPPPPDDDSCINDGDKWITYKAKKAGEALKICIGDCAVEFEGCSYNAYPTSSPEYEKIDCFFDAEDEVSCRSKHYPIGASSGNEEVTGNDNDSTQETKKDSETDVTSSTTPENVQNDVPDVGDTQTTQTTTETKEYTDSEEISITSESVKIKTTTGGNVETTTTTTTTTYSDGSTKTDVTTTYTQTPINQTEEKANLNTGSTSTTTNTTPSQSGSTTTSTTTNADGSTSTTTNSTGSGGTGNGNGDERGDDGEEFGDFNETGSGTALYESDDDLTVDGVLSDFKNDVFNTEVVNSISTFFDINISGSCPIWTIPAVWIFPAITIDMQCSQVMEDIWPYISAVILIGASFLAFRWGVL